MQIHHATTTDLDLVAPLFDAYRQFYHLPADLPRSRAFIGDRLTLGDSAIYLADRKSVV